LHFAYLVAALAAFQIGGLQSVPPAAAPSNSSASRPAIVRGKVVAADTGLPVARAQVGLRANGAASTPYTAATDANGQFEIRNVDPGSYTATANKSGYLGGTLRRGMFTIADGQEVNDADFVLPRAAVITGSVIDDHNEPIAGVMVQAVLKDYSSGYLQLQARGVATLTDDRGRFRIHDLGAGRYYVRAARHVTGDPAPLYAPVFYPSASRVADAQAIKLAGGDEAPGIKLQMHESIVHRVSGRVVDVLTGQGSPGAMIYLAPDDVFTGPTATATAAADGTFRLSEVPAGVYRLNAMLRDLGATRTVVNSSRTIQVGDRDLEDLSIIVGPGTTIRGRVVAAGADFPPGVKVQLQPRSPATGTGTGGSLMVMTQQDGSFEMVNVQPGTYEVTAFPGDFRRPAWGQTFFFTSSVTAGSQDVIDTGLTVAEQTPSIELSITLDARAGTITGTALDSDNNPLKHTSVALISADPKRRNSLRYFERAQSDPKGMFRVEGVIPGDYLMLVWPGGDPGALFDPDVVESLNPYFTRVSVPAAGSVQQDLYLNSDVLNIVHGLGQE